MDALDWTTAWPLNGYYSAFVDPKKSLPHKNDKGHVENLRGLPFWIPLQRYLVDVNDYIDVASQIDSDEFVINDPNTKEALVRFRVAKGKSGIWNGELGNGMLLFQYTPELMSYRKRDDGLLGLESLSRFDTRLSRSEYLKTPKKFPPHVKKTNSKEANFSNL